MAIYFPRQKSDLILQNEKKKPPKVTNVVIQAPDQVFKDCSIY